MNQCTHDFKTLESTSTHVRVVCVYCGQVRKVWGTGQIEVVLNVGNVTYKQNGQIQDKNSTGNVKL